MQSSRAPTVPTTAVPPPPQAAPLGSHLPPPPPAASALAAQQQQAAIMQIVQMTPEMIAKLPAEQQEQIRLVQQHFAAMQVQQQPR